MRILYTVCLAIVLALSVSCSHKKGESTASSDTVLVEKESSESSKSETVKANVSGNNETGEADNVLTHLVNNGLPTIIDFTAVWCPPCKYMKPIFHKLAKEFYGEYNFVSIDIDEQPELADKYHIQAVPTFVFIDADGVEGDRIKGAVSENELRDRLLNPAWF